MLATRITAISLVLIALAALVVAACGGGGEEEPQVGGLTDSEDVPTATPWAEPPGSIILDPTALTPVPGGSDGDDDGGDGGTDSEVTPVEPFAVTSGDSTNLRDEPSTEGAITGTLDAGDEATVTGEVQGEAVTAGNDLWYQLDSGDFVYSGAVDRVD